VADPKVNDKFAHKLDFLENMRIYFEGRAKQDDRQILVGDFNIAPHVHDVWGHKQDHIWVSPALKPAVEAMGKTGHEIILEYWFLFRSGEYRARACLTDLRAA